MHTISVTVSQDFLGSPRSVYEKIEKTGDYLDQMMTQYGPIPGVQRVKMLTKKWGVAGAKRLVYMTDGTMATDHLLKVEKPKSFSYEVIDITFGLKYLVRRIVGKWQFVKKGNKTRVIWTYGLEAKSLLFMPILYPVAHLLVRPYIDQALHAIKQRTAH